MCVVGWRAYIKYVRGSVSMGGFGLVLVSVGGYGLDVDVGMG